MATPVRPDIETNVKAIRAELGNSLDVILRRFRSGTNPVRHALLLYLDGMVASDQVETILRSAMELTHSPYGQTQVSTDPLTNWEQTVAQLPEVTSVDNVEHLIELVLMGQTALFLEGETSALVLDTRKPPSRSVEEPTTEAEVRGPRDGFIEDLLTNVGLIRRRIRDPRLRVESVQVGRRTKTDVAFIYIKDLAEPALVDEVRKRIQSIDVDTILGSGYVDEFISDNPLSPFGGLNYTERPDKVCGNLQEGRVGIMVDGTPFALIVPTTFWQLLQAPGDYYQGFQAATAFRWLRMLAVLIALTLPSLYTILGSFHHEMIPTPLALSMAAGREGTPLPTLVEVLALTVMFEVMHEAGLRLPRAVGQTVSIVGSLVIGEAAVQAGLVAPATVIVVSAAGITGFAIPSYALSLAVRLLQIPLLVLSGMLGVFGFVGGTAFLALHAASIRSFGQPFLSPIAPLHPKELGDTLVRSPHFLMNWRPHLNRGGKPSRRQADNQMPKPPGSGNKGGGRS